MAYEAFKGLTRRTGSDNTLRDKAFNITKSYFKVDLLQWIINFLIKTSGGEAKNENISKKVSGEELHKPIFKKVEKRKVHSTFIDNIWGADLADVQLIRDLDFHYV